MRREASEGLSGTAVITCMAGWVLLIGLAGGCGDARVGDTVVLSDGSGFGDGGPDGGRAGDAVMLDGEADDGAAIDEGPEGGLPDASGGRITLENHAVETCDPETVVYAILPDERGHWAAERLVPPSTPFIVDSIEYQLSGPTRFSRRCATAVPHRVFVVTAPEGRPPASPEAMPSHRTFDVRPPDTASWVSEIALEPPLVVGAGEVLFVGVEIGATDDLARTQLCIVVCGEATGPRPGASFWSNATTPPYPWSDLMELDIPNYAIRAHGVEGR